MSGEERTELAKSLVQTALTDYENVDEVDAIQVTITSAYDIGIARGNIRSGETQTVQVWRQALSQP